MPARPGERGALVKVGHPNAPRCHCCGAPQLTESNARVLIALGCAGSATLYDLARVAEVSARNIRLFKAAHPNYFRCLGLGRSQARIWALTTEGYAAWTRLRSGAQRRAA